MSPTAIDRLSITLLLSFGTQHSGESFFPEAFTVVEDFVDLKVNDYRFSHETDP